MSGLPLVRAWRARSWPTTRGTVTAAIVTVQEVSGVSHGMNRLVSVEYRYGVDGNEYLGTRITFFDILMRHTFEETADAHVRRFGKGKQIEVRYDPRHPEQAVVETRVPWTFYFASAVSALFLVSGAITLCRLILR